MQIFIFHFVFRRQPAEFFFSKKKWLHESRSKLQIWYYKHLKSCVGLLLFVFWNFYKKMMIHLKYKWQNNFHKLSLPMTEPEPWCWNSFCKAVEGLVRKFSSSCPSTCSELEFLFRGLPSPQFNTYKMITKNKCGPKVVNYTF